MTRVRKATHTPTMACIDEYGAHYRSVFHHVRHFGQLTRLLLGMLAERWGCPGHPAKTPAHLTQGVGMISPLVSPAAYRKDSPCDRVRTQSLGTMLACRRDRVSKGRVPGKALLSALTLWATNRDKSRRARGEGERARNRAGETGEGGWRWRRFAGMSRGSLRLPLPLC
jgi:hypothetical protein